MSTSTPKDGGPAFPVVGQPNPSAGPLALAGQLDHGMTLRDYFAAAAITAEWMGALSFHEQAELAYKLADAMLAERARKEAQPWGDDQIMRQNLNEGGTPT